MSVAITEQSVLKLSRMALIPVQLIQSVQKPLLSSSLSIKDGTENQCMYVIHSMQQPHWQKSNLNFQVITRNGRGKRDTTRIIPCSIFSPLHFVLYLGKSTKFGTVQCLVVLQVSRMALTFVYLIHSVQKPVLSRSLVGWSII